MFRNVTDLLLEKELGTAYKKETTPLLTNAITFNIHDDLRNDSIPV
jgi:hypothetical protein